LKSDTKSELRVHRCDLNLLRRTVISLICCRVSLLFLHVETFPACILGLPACSSIFIFFQRIIQYSFANLKQVTLFLQPGGCKIFVKEVKLNIFTSLKFVEKWSFCYKKVKRVLGIFFIPCSVPNKEKLCLFYLRQVCACVRCMRCLCWIAAYV
jgi:hypothetical protein